MAPVVLIRSFAFEIRVRLLAGGVFSIIHHEQAETRDEARENLWTSPSNLLALFSRFTIEKSKIAAIEIEDSDL